MTRPDWRRLWSWTVRLAVLVLLAQACGGDSGKSTGASGPTEITVNLRGIETAQLARGCTGTLTATRAGFAPRSSTIPSSGVVVLFLSLGEWTFIVEIDCPQADGTTRHITAQQTANVGQGNLVLDFPVRVNASPRVAVSCGSTCQCSASDPENDPLSASWSSNGSLSNDTGFSTDVTCPSGTCEVTCTVTDGRGGIASASATVGEALVTLTVTASTVSVGGTVTSSPAGISCTTSSGVPCSSSASFPVGTSVTLTASPSFSGLWGGACAPFGGGATCTLTLTGSTSASRTL